MTPVSERGLANSQLKSKVLGAQDGRELVEWHGGSRGPGGRELME